MSQRAPRRKLSAGPRYYRTPSLWGLVFTFVLVLILIFFLVRMA